MASKKANQSALLENVDAIITKAKDINKGALKVSNMLVEEGLETGAKFQKIFAKSLVKGTDLFEKQQDLAVENIEEVKNLYIAGTKRFRKLFSIDKMETEIKAIASKATNRAEKAMEDVEEEMTEARESVIKTTMSMMKGAAAKANEIIAKVAPKADKKVNTAKKATAKKIATAKKSVAKKVSVNKQTVKTVAKKVVKKATAKKVVAKKAAPVKKAVAKVAAKKTVAKKARVKITKPVAKKATTKVATKVTKPVANKTVAKKATTKVAAKVAKPVAKKAPIAKKAPAVKAAAKKTTPAKKATPVTSKSVNLNDLKLITGVGPKLEQILKTAGYKTITDISKAKSADLQVILEKAGPRYKMFDSKIWIENAKSVAKK